MIRAKSYQIIPNKNKGISKANMKNKKIFKEIKEESKNNTLGEKSFETYMSKKAKEREYYLLQKFKEIKKPKTKGKKELYKINIRQTTAWNQEFINNIIPKRKFGLVIEGQL